MSIEVLKISNYKHQIPRKYQISISNDSNRFGILNLGHWGFVCYLGFVIWNFHSRLHVSFALKLAVFRPAARLNPEWLNLKRGAHP
jgi:hypothetical protein